MVKRRKFERLEVPIPLSMRLLGVFGYPPPANAETRNISLEGLSIELQEGEESLNLIPYLVLDKKGVELDIEIPPKGERIRAIGRVIWYDFGSRETLYYFRVGVFLEEMEIEDRKKWESFVRNIAQEEDEDLTQKQTLTEIEEEAKA
ncbi:MAG: PilZ domain-containing protein [Deltaproteobacteria bacterium]|nr:PilZ domain-containing protein [Deltaproteobacteria bacterium]